jgi:holo-[acyl-carrier protein] synthase
MIYGIGTDLVEINRIEAALAQFGDRFAQRILGPQELQRYRSRSARSVRRGVCFLATRFAAKEAIAKALGLGMRTPMSWRAAQVINAASGRPQVLLHGALNDYATERKLRLHISVSDEREMAIAHAIAEKIAEGE